VLALGFYLLAAATRRWSRRRDCSDNRCNRSVRHPTHHRELPSKREQKRSCRTESCSNYEGRDFVTSIPSGVQAHVRAEPL